jgi:hypothetical protein
MIILSQLPGNVDNSVDKCSKCGQLRDSLSSISSYMNMGGMIAEERPKD